MNKNTSIKTVKLVQEIGSEIDWNEKKNKQLVEAILALETANETERFLRDIMTEQEILDFSNRLEAASLLSQDIQYNFITESTGLSSKTIARIAKWLNGSLGGYRLILNRITQNQSKLGTGHSNSSKIRKGLSLSS
ncbi:MAG: YerC/YecD family TrpR-related protein [Patescibacteria group bacterium]